MIDKVGIENESGNKYFHIMLNISDDDLDVYEYRLLGHYIRICNVYGTGKCWESTRTTATKCKMSVGKVSSTRIALEQKGYLKFVQPNDHSKGDTLMVLVVDKWADNIDRYSEKENEQWQNSSLKPVSSAEINSSVHPHGEELNGANNANRYEATITKLHMNLVTALLNEPLLWDAIVNDVEKKVSHSITVSKLATAAELDSTTLNSYVQNAIEKNTLPKNNNAFLSSYCSYSEHQRSYSEHQCSPHETIKNKRKRIKEEIPPIVPQLTIQKTELELMEDIIQTELKQYGKQKTKVAKAMLGLLTGKSSEYNIKSKMTPEMVKQYLADWDKKIDRDGNVLIRPRNLGSNKANVDTWLDMRQSQQNRPQSLFQQKAPVNLGMIEKAN